jgi:hypothetical protein
MTAAALMAALAAAAQAGTTPAAAPATGAAPLVVGEIRLDREDIFTRAEVDSARGLGRFAQSLANRLHGQTRPHILRHEFLFRTGDPYRPALLAETARNLRALGYLADVSVAAVDTTPDGRVDVSVATRESWSLETDITYALDAGGAARWTAQLADNNFLGYGVTVGAGLGRDLVGRYWNLWYRQRRVAGTGLSLGLDYADRSEGHVRRVELGKPFYALDDPRGTVGKAWDDAWRNRFYLSNGGPAGGDAGRAASLYAELPYTDTGVEVGLQWRLSPRARGRIWRLGAGARVQERRFTPDRDRAVLSDGRTVPLGWLSEPGQPYAREQGTTAFPYLWLRTVSRDWVTARHLLQYGGLEDIELGWDLDLKAGPAGGTVGSTTAGGSSRRWRVESVLQDWFRLGPGHAVLLGTLEADLGAVAARNHRWTLLGGWLTVTGPERTPWLTRVFVEVGQGAGLTGARPFLLGSERGLRTLPVDGRAGDRLLRANLEVGRATGVMPFGLFRLGVAAFADAGSAWWHDEARGAGDLRREVGLGLRFGPTRSANAPLARLDLAWPLDGGGPELAAVTGGWF